MPEDILKAHCNECQQDTNHTVIASHTQTDSQVIEDDGYPITSVDWSAVYHLLECRGCEAVCVRRRVYFSEWDHGEYEETFHPPRVSRSIPSWADELPERMYDLIVEVYRALQSDSRRLGAMGARAILDMFIVEKVDDIGTFREKLDRLEAEGYVGRRQRDLLDAALDAGNAAAHRGHLVSSAELNSVMDIIENLLQTDLLAPEAEALRRSVPARPGRQRDTTSVDTGGTEDAQPEA